MKRNIGIILIIFSIFLTIGYLIFLSNLSFFIIVATLSDERAKNIANDIMKDNLICTVILLFIMTIINFFILKKLIKTNKSVLKSSAISIFTFILLLIINLEFKKNFIEQNRLEYNKYK